LNFVFRKTSFPIPGRVFCGRGAAGAPPANEIFSAGPEPFGKHLSPTYFLWDELPEKIPPDGFRIGKTCFMRKPHGKNPFHAEAAQGKPIPCEYE